MEPKDLKNPEGLESTEKSEKENSENRNSSKENKAVSNPYDLSDSKLEGEVPAKGDAVELQKEAANSDEKQVEEEDDTETQVETVPEVSDEDVSNTEEEAEPSSKVPDEATDDIEAESEPAPAVPDEVLEVPRAQVEPAPETPDEATDDIEAESEPSPKVSDEATDDSEEKAEPAPAVMDEALEVPRAQVEPSPEAPDEATDDIEAEAEPAPEVMDEVADDAIEQAEPSLVASDKVAAQQNEPPIKDQKKQEKSVSKKPEKPDYSTFAQIELVNALRELLDSNGDHDIKDEVEVIRAAFYKMVKEEEEEQKSHFIEEGGEEAEFEPEENPYEPDIKDLLKRFRHIRHEFNKKMDQEKELNLQVKYEIIEEIKGLIHKEESINKTFQDFRDLQQRWREVGLVPQSKMKDLWDTYHFHVESFYDYIKINKELRDLDLKKNLEMKIRLCEQAEELLLETNTIKAFNLLQRLHERWREIGPVPRENKDDIWERFKASTAKINKRHQEYFENRKAEQRENLEAKKALCEQIEDINQLELTSHKEWGEKSKEVINLQKVWRTIGFAPSKDNNRIYKRFREACDLFFDTKRDFYSRNKEHQQHNLQLKTDLCMQAEALKESTDWHKTTQDLINIQKQWKEIGPVPRKNSDILWKRFRAACDNFFEKKGEYFSTIDSEQGDNLKKKEELIKDVENFTPIEDADQNLDALKDFQRRWTEIGHVPIKKKDEIQKRFREVINKLFDDLNLDESKRNLIKFRTKIASFSESSRGQSKMRLERDKYMTKLKQLESDLVLLDNNIGFFAKSKNAETLIKDVKKKIEQTKEKIEFLKDKIRMIDEIDRSED